MLRLLLCRINLVNFTLWSFSALWYWIFGILLWIRPLGFGLQALSQIFGMYCPYLPCTVFYRPCCWALLFLRTRLIKVSQTKKSNFQKCWVTPTFFVFLMTRLNFFSRLRFTIFTSLSSKRVFQFENVSLRWQSWWISPKIQLIWKRMATAKTNHTYFIGPSFIGPVIHAIPSNFVLILQTTHLSHQLLQYFILK